MNKITEVMGQFDTRSKIRAIQSASAMIQSSQDQLKAANSVITSFGIKPVAAEDVARVVALSLVECALESGTSQPTDRFIEFAMGRFEKQAKKMAIYSQATVELEPLADGESPVLNTAASDKQARARIIYDQMLGKASKNAIVKEIAKQLEITVGNAGFIVYRKFAGKK